MGLVLVTDRTSSIIRQIFWSCVGWDTMFWVAFGKLVGEFVTDVAEKLHEEGNLEFKI